MFKNIKDNRGTVSVIDFDDVDLKPKRVFILHNLNKNKTRGNHYHKKCNEHLFIISGECIFDLECKKTQKKNSIKMMPSMQIKLPTYTKITIKNATKDCVICVFCDKHYDPKDVYYD